MPRTIKNAINPRLALTIAAGIFGGLLSYRLAVGAHAWWVDLSMADQQQVLGLALIASLAALAHYGLRRLITKLNQCTPPTASDVAHWSTSRRKHVVRSAFAAVLAFSLLLAARSDAWVSFCVIAAIGVGWGIFRFRARARLVKQTRAQRLNAMLDTL